MSIDVWYCEHCGAASSLEQIICFACGQTQAEKSEHESLLHERYRLQVQVGTGGFGCVYHALDTRENNRSVAIKQINLRGLSSQQMIEATDAFNREVHILTTLSHPQLPTIYEHFTDPEHWYLVMSFIAGETLEQALERQQRQAQLAAPDQHQLLLPLNEILNLALQLCKVLDYLHSRTPPIIFRDLKPANIMKTPDTKYILIDFGIARLFKPGQQKDTIPFGSPGYAAPEQYGKAQTSARSDIYSLGALLHYLVSGNDPAEAPFRFTSLSAYGTLELQALEALVMRMVALDVMQRPTHIAEVQAEIQQIMKQHVSRPLWSPSIGQTLPITWPSVTNYGGTAQQQQIRPQATPVSTKQPTRRTFLRTSIITGSVITAGATTWKILAAHTPHPPQIIEPPSPTAYLIPVTPSISDDGSFAVQYNNSQNQFTFTNINSNSQTSSIAADLTPSLNNQPTALALTPDKKALLIGFQDLSIALYGISPDAPYRTSNKLSFNKRSFQVPQLSWSPDSAYFAVIMEQPPAIELWPEWLIWENNPDPYSVTINGADPTSLAWSLDARSIVVGDSLGELHIFDVLTGVKQSEYTEQMHFQQDSGNGSFYAINALDWSPWGNIASGDDNYMLFVWNASTGKTQARIQCPDGICHVKWSPDGRYLAVVCKNMKVYIWDMQTQKFVLSQFYNITNVCPTVAWLSVPAGGYDLIVVEPNEPPKKIRLPLTK